MQTKLPHYMLPTYPFLSLLLADTIVRSIDGEFTEFFRKPFRIGVAIWAVPVGLVASLPWLATQLTPALPDLPYAAMVAVSLGGLACTIGTWWFFHRRKVALACAYLGVSFLVLIDLRPLTSGKFATHPGIRQRATALHFCFLFSALQYHPPPDLTQTPVLI